MSNELNAVLDLCDEAEQKLARLLGSVAYQKGVRAAVEELALRAWQRGAKKSPPALPKGVHDKQLDASQRATPVINPRPAIDVVVPMGRPRKRDR